jgi:uncharacterized protein
MIAKTIAYVKQELKDAEAGHDWFHIERVYNLAMMIAKTESCDIKVVQYGALLHDIADSKFHDGDETIGSKKASNFLKSINESDEVINHVIKIIENISFKGGNFKQDFKSKELDIVQDADRLDAMGAIGIARTFNYGGFKNMPLYDPEIKPNLNMDKNTYKKSKAPTINHFHEKLLLLKDRMNTNKGSEIAQIRHNFMVDYLQQFENEWHVKV